MNKSNGCPPFTVRNAHLSVKHDNYNQSGALIGPHWRCESCGKTWNQYSEDTDLPDSEIGLRVLFLDVDGVLNSRQFHDRRLKEGKVLQFDDLDPSTIARLNQIIEENRCTVVLSSTWRRYFSVSKFTFHARKFGFKYEVESSTPILDDSKSRGEEIKAWIDANPHVQSIVILDDDSDMHPVADRLVQTHFSDGLQDRHVAEVRAMFQK